MNSKRNGKSIKAVVLAVLVLASVILTGCDEPVGNNGQSCIGQATTCLYEVVTGK